ncbi:hypothetical protein HMPREF0083_02651 [Aneurinibacillus aneurinilyticus ATCC 12856]|jgi:hypothetical protein|uniref:Uncharacterized protein n=1 Tax=Aneurinibacillus aneurinilyticus ATCC 12856 TaxID=649747 RepID=U1YET3_ANEAE|nr:hypothetical protein HMPREF0083_02651 [Aneurinibacillus aneurinilyticus ATCC 12856]
MGIITESRPGTIAHYDAYCMEGSTPIIFMFLFGLFFLSVAGYAASIMY